MVKLSGKQGANTWLHGLHHHLQARRQFLGGSLYEYVVVGVVFFLLTLILTNFTLLHGSHQLFIDGPGDGTAGFLWYNSTDKDLNPLLAHTDMANYPTGENLGNPTQITYSMILLPLWVMSRVFGPTMGLNIITFFGFWSCGVAAYWLIKKLTHDPFVAFFAGYAAAYTPYHLAKSSSHLTYIFSVVFVLILAAFIGYWKRPTFRRAILFALSLGVAFYTDGYFLLIGSVFAFSLLLGGVAYDLLTGRFKGLLTLRLKHAAVVVGTVAVLLVPIGVMQLTQASKVNGFLSNARGDIAFDIEYYSTHYIDYLTPAPLNPFLKDNPSFQKIVAYQNTRSNSSENGTYIGWVLIVLVTIGGALLVSYIFNKKKSHLRTYPYVENYKLLYAIGFFAIPILVLCMLSPSLSVKGVHLPTLGYALLHFHVTLWRVMARFYLPLHVVFVAMASIVLAALVSRYRPVWPLKNTKPLHIFLYIAIVGSATLLMAAEYASMNSRPSYDFHHIPKVYTWIKNQADIKVMAELPLLDRPLTPNYNFATAQVIHGKKLINTPLTNNIPGTRTALGDADSSEAIDYAIARGADTIITHDKPCVAQSWGSVVYVDQNKPQTRESVYYGSPVCVYKVNKAYKADPFFVQLQHGTFADVPYITKDGSEYQMVYGADGWLHVTDALGNKVQGRAMLSADIQSTPDGPVLKGAWSISQGGKELASGTVPGKIMAEDVDVSQPIHLHVTDETGAAPKIFQVSLDHIVVNQAKPTAP